MKKLIFIGVMGLFVLGSCNSKNTGHEGHDHETVTHNHDAVSYTHLLSDYYGVSKRTENREGTIIFDGYKQDGTKNDIAITGANAQQVYYSRLNDIDESSVYDNSFIKLREVAVSYKVLQKKWMELSVNAFARNILVWAQTVSYTHLSISQLQKLLKQRQESTRQAQISMQQAQESMLQKQ